MQLLPTIFGVTSGLFFGGALVPIVGFLPPFMYLGMSVFCLGTGLLVLLDQYSSTSAWAGFTFIIGFGSGMVWQLPFIASQTVLKPHEIEVGTACVIFTQTLGGTIFFAVNQAIYQNYFTKNVMKIPNLPNASEIAEGGVTAFRSLAPASFIPQLEDIAIHAIRRTWYGPSEFFIFAGSVCSFLVSCTAWNWVGTLELSARSLT